MKVIQIDLHNQESEVLVAENVNTRFGELIVELLNRQPGSGCHYALKLNGYKLFTKVES